MTTSFDDLVEQLLYDVALSGSKGIGADEVTTAINAFHESQKQKHRPAADVGGESLLFSDAPPDDSITVDEALASAVWDWLVNHPDLRISDVGNGEATPLDVSDGSRTSRASVRIFASNEKIWQTITGHGPDFKRVPAKEFDLLSIIAAHGPKGIIQPDLVRLSQQDKRSVPKRTDVLAQKGYILKEKVIAAKSQTALLKLWKYVSGEDAGPRHVQAYTNDKNTAGSDILYYDKWYTLLMKMLQDNNGIAALDDLRHGLSVPPTKLGRRSLARCLDRLVKRGVLRKVKARVEHDLSGNPGESWAHCVQLLKEPTDADRIAMRGLGIEKLSGHNDVGDAGRDNPEDGEDHDEHVAGGVNVPDDDESDADMVGDVRIPPQWNPDLPINNLIFRVVDSAGADGISTMDLVARITGPFWRRPLEEVMSNLTDLWQTSQPAHLRHLTIVRDTGIHGKSTHYKYFSMANFEKAVEAGKARWEAIVGPQKAQTKKKGRPRLEAAPEGLDDWGFPALDPKLLAGVDGRANLLQGQTAAKREFSQTAKAKSFQSASGDLNLLLSIPQGRNHRGPQRSRRVDAGTPRTSQKRKMNSPINDDEGDKNKRRKVAELPADTATIIPAESAITDAELPASTAQDELAEQPSPLPAASAMVEPTPLRKPRTSWIEDEVAARSSPGVFVDPPDAKEWRFSGCNKRGRRPKNMVVVFKSDKLKHLEWFAGDHSSSVSPSSPKPSHARPSQTTTLDALIQSPPQASKIQDPPVVSAVRQDNAATDHPGLYDSEYTQKYPEIRWQHRGHGRYAVALSPAPTTAASIGLVTRDVTVTVSDAPHSATEVLEPLSSTSVGEAASSEQQHESVSISGDVHSGPANLPPTPVPITDIRTQANASIQTESRDQPSQLQGNTQSRTDADLPADQGAVNDDSDDDDFDELDALPDLILSRFPETETPASSKSGVSRKAGSVRAERFQIVMDAVKAAGGVFPGTNAMWYPFRTVWQRKYNLQADRTTVDHLVEEIVRSRQLNKYEFSFVDYKGRLQKQDILTLPYIGSASIRAKTVQKAIIDHYPQIFLPKEADIPQSPSDTVARRPSENTRGEPDVDEMSIAEEVSQWPVTPLPRFGPKGDPAFPVVGDVTVRRTMPVQRNAAIPSRGQKSRKVAAPRSILRSARKVGRGRVADVQPQQMQSYLAAPGQIFHAPSGTIGTVGTIGHASDSAEMVETLWKRYQVAPRDLPDILLRAKMPLYSTDESPVLPLERFFNEIEKVQEWEENFSVHNSLMGPTGGFVFIDHGLNQPHIREDHGRHSVEASKFREWDPSPDKQPSMRKTRPAIQASKQDGLIKSTPIRCAPAPRETSQNGTLSNVGPAEEPTLQDRPEPRLSMLLPQLLPIEGPFTFMPVATPLSVAQDFSAMPSIAASPPAVTSGPGSPSSVTDAEAGDFSADESSASESIENASSIRRKAPPVKTSQRSGLGSKEPQNYGDDICAACIRNHRNCFGGSETEKCTFCKPTKSYCTRVAADREYLVRRDARRAERARRKAELAEKLRLRAEKKAEKEQATEERREQLALQTALKAEEAKLNADKKAAATQRRLEKVARQEALEGEKQRKHAEDAQKDLERAADQDAVEKARAVLKDINAQPGAGSFHVFNPAAGQAPRCLRCVKANKTCHGGSSTNKCASCKTGHLLCSKVDADREQLLKWGRLETSTAEDNSTTVASTERQSRRNSTTLTSIQSTPQALVPLPRMTPPIPAGSLDGSRLQPVLQPTKRKLPPPPSFELSGLEVRKKPRRTEMPMIDGTFRPIKESYSDTIGQPNETERTKTATKAAQALIDPVPPNYSDTEYEPTKSKKSTQIKAKKARQPTFPDILRLNIAVVLVDMLCSGTKDESDRDWNIVAHALAFKYEPEVLSERWKLQKRSSRAFIARLQLRLSEPFLRAYESGDVAKIDFVNLHNTDWPALVRWVETNVLPFSDEVAIENLPESREELENNFAVEFQSQDSERSVVTANADQACDLMIAKSWARALTLTEHINYNVQQAAKKMTTLNPRTLNAAVAELEATHTLVRKKAGRQLPGRNFLISKDALSCFKRWPGEMGDFNYLRKVAAARNKWVAYFQHQDRIAQAPNMSELDVFILTEMLGQGHLKLESTLSENAFKPNAINGAVAEHGILPVVWTKTWKFTIEHNLAKTAVPIPSESSFASLRTAIPMWVDINGNLLADVWDMVLRSILHVLIDRPDSTAKTIEVAHVGHLWEWEIEIVLRWMEEMGLAKRHGNAVMGETVKGGWRASEWWYCAFAPEIARWKLPTGAFDQVEV